MEGVRDTYAAVRTPMVVANSIDDPWSPPKSRDAIMTGYVCAPWMPVDIDPAAFRTALSPKGENSATLFLTRVGGKRRALLAERL